MTAVLCVAGIDAETARKEEEEMMLRDANQWLNAGCYCEHPHPKTGAYALHVAAAKGYIKVIKYVWCHAQLDSDVLRLEGSVSNEFYIADRIRLHIMLC